MVAAWRESAPPSLKRSSRVLRNRPGERPTWINASQARTRWSAWRTVAAEARLQLDAAISCAVEFEAVCRDLAELGIEEPAELLPFLAVADAAEPRLAPTPALRAWVEQLEGTSLAGVEDDELPEVVIPSRVVRMLQGRPIDEFVVASRIRAAVTAEVQAARRGLTLDGWALRRVVGRG